MEVIKNKGLELEEYKDLSRLSYLRVPSISRAVVYPRNAEELIFTVDTLNLYGIKYVILGRMSNVLIRNDFYDGVIVITNRIHIKNEAENEVELSCGASLKRTIRSMSLKNYGGLEGLYAIPGSVGGMVRQNAGAFGYEISDRFVSAICYVPGEGELRTFYRSDMQFSYRYSALMNNDAVLISARFDFVEKERERIDEEISRYALKRKQTQPLSAPSLGSVFKRRNGVSAAFYIDRAGLKGYSIGGAQVSETHAGFIVNNGGATAADYLKLVEYVKKVVQARFGVELDEEIEVI